MSDDENKRFAGELAAAYLVCNKDTFNSSDMSAFLKQFQSAYDNFLDMLEAEQKWK